MRKFRHKLMLQESAKRFHGSEILSSSGDDSDSAYLLKLVGFELLLKVVVEQSTQRRAHGHDYEKLFGLLPPELQTNILRIAGKRIGPSQLSVDHNEVLADLGSNFVKLRYPYDKYSHMTQQEYSSVGAAWIEAGANNEDADYRYHPEELFGLVFAFKQVVNPC